jgi:hypothetical protein
MRPSGASRPSVRMWPDDGGYRLEVDLPEGTRSLRDGDCRALFRAAIVIAALGEQAPAPAPNALPAGTRLAERLSAPSPSASSEALRDRTNDASFAAANTPAAAPTRNRAPLEGETVAAAAVHVGLTPVASAWVAAGAELGRERWRVRLLLGYLTPSASERRMGAAVRVDGVGASLAADYRALRWLTLTGGADLTLLHGKGLGALVARSDWTSVPGLHAGLSLQLFESARFRLELPVILLLSLARSRFLVSGRGPLHRTETFGFRGGIQGSVQFR